jgi:hypothetical protein
LLKVVPAQGRLRFNNYKCYDLQIPDKYRNDGVEDADIHIFVSY